jgi:formate dehydrogenase iron-sulfur subunit
MTVSLPILSKVARKAREQIENFPNAFPPRRTPVPDPQQDADQMVGFLTDTTICIGCKACEVACKQWNQLPSDGLNFTGFSYDNTGHLSATTWRHVTFKEKTHADGSAQWLMMSDVCKHCQDAPCLNSCPTGALVYNSFGDVYLQNDICNGCGYCISACPFGVLSRADGESDDGHAHKCTLCADRQEDGHVPACAKACPTESIKFGPLKELQRYARERVETLHARGHTDAYLYGADDSLGDYGNLNAFFILEDHPNNYNLPEAPVQPERGQRKRYALGLFAGLALSAVAAALFASADGSTAPCRRISRWNS